MSDWFSFWGGKQTSDTSSLSSTLSTTESIKDANKMLKFGKELTGTVEGITSLLNLSVYKKEHENSIKAIENEVLAGQEQIFRDLAYNTDQAMAHAARGNVSISSPVLRNRMARGAKEAGFDFGMIRANANIKKINADIKYAAKRKATLEKGLGSIQNLLMKGMGSFGGGGGGVAVDPMQVASANNSL